MKLNTAKKLTAGALALSMMFAMATPAFALTSPEIQYSDMTSVMFTKTYEATNPNTTSPEETFQFEIEGVGVTDAASGVTIGTYGMPTVGTVSYTAGEAGSANKAKKITVALPTYGSVGIYTYKITEKAQGTAGVTYWGKDIILKVTVVEQGGKIRVAAVHTEDAKADGTYDTSKGGTSTKNDTFPNTYSAGSLAVTKNVTGNLGDKDKKFEVTVTFKAPEGKTVKEAIKYSEDGKNKTIATSAWKNGEAEVKINLADSDTVTFMNIPYDVTYTVVEKDYKTTDGYDDADYNFSDIDKKIDSANDTVTITNNKGGTVDTGVILDNAPYILMLAVVAGGAMTLVIKKRREEE